ncbi:MAG: trimeric intracellular cation channel family protein [Clostridia bacterium]|nr:trimeric intracellular cation channel family protein [Clostridia bacterium]
MLVIDVLDLAGTAAFAISGALVGIKNRLDLFGIFVLAVVTASGGGLMRDVIIGDYWPAFFSQPKYLISIIISTAAICVCLKYMGKMATLIRVFDAIGLGVFTVLSAYKCMKFDMPLIGIIFTAMLTGIGGGVLRDVMVRSVPLVFRSEIYALASIIGALMFYFLYGLINLQVNIYLCVFVTFAIRMVSMYYNLNLPVIKPKSEDTGVQN